MDLKPSQTPASPPGAVSDLESQEDEDMRDSQRPGAWLGNAYVLYNQLEREEEKAKKTVVPVSILYEWLVDGTPSETEYLGTFSEDDLKQLD